MKYHCEEFLSTPFLLSLLSIMMHRYLLFLALAAYLIQTHGALEDHGGWHGEYTSHIDHHHHGGEQHSHGGQHHYHSGKTHFHSGEYHSHSGEWYSHSGEQHSHSDEQHSHNNQQHSHSGEQHSHSDEQHTHSGEQHYHESHSHSGTGNAAAAHALGGDHHHHHDHKDSDENGEHQQFSQPLAEPVTEPAIVATRHQSHHNHHGHNQSRSRSSTRDPLQMRNDDHHHRHHHRHHHHEVHTKNQTTAPTPKSTMSKYVPVSFFLLPKIVQMPEAEALQTQMEPLTEENDLNAQVKELQKNVSELWTYIYTLRNSVSIHLMHLRQHQEELEITVHRLEHHHDGHGGSHGEYSSRDVHHHSGDQHSHSGEHHSHSGEHHSHSGEHHSHSGEHHSHNGEHHSHSGEHHSHSGEHHSHSGEQHSHSGEQHSHSGEQHSHSGEHHHHESHSHSHTTTANAPAAHTHDDDHHQHQQKDSHENDDIQQLTQQVSEPVIEPVVVATQHQSHYNRQNHSHSRSGSTTRDPLQLMNESSFHHHHHDHHRNEPSTRNKIDYLPKYSEYNLYDFAICDVQPNRAIAEELQQEIVGQVALWQKKRGGQLSIHVRLQGFNVGDHHAGHHGSQQELQQEEDNETPTQKVGHKHGFHIHASGDLSNGCQSAGPHFNPKNVTHGAIDVIVRHVGDLGNIECDANGVTNILFTDHVASLKGPHSIIGKSIVIHSDIDDLGQGGNPESLKTGNAGTRLACCVIQKVEKLPVKTYKAIKSATLYRRR